TRPARGRSRPRSRAPPRRERRTGGSTDRRIAGSVEPRRRCSRSPRRGSRPRARRLSLHESEDHDEVTPVHLQGIPPLGLLAEPHLRAQGAARRHREVLLTVDRIAHDAARLRGAEAEGPELLTILRVERDDLALGGRAQRDRKSTRLNSSHVAISYAVFCLKKTNNPTDYHSHSTLTKQWM